MKNLMWKITKVYNDKKQVKLLKTCVFDWEICILFLLSHFGYLHIRIALLWVTKL